MTYRLRVLGQEPYRAGALSISYVICRPTKKEAYILEPFILQANILSPKRIPYPSYIS